MIVLADDRLGLISAGGFHNGGSCSPLIYSGICFASRNGRSGIESRWGRDFPSVQTGPGTLPASCKMGTRSFPEVKCGRGVLLTPHPF